MKKKCTNKKKKKKKNNFVDNFKSNARTLETDSESNQNLIRQ